MAPLTWRNVDAPSFGSANQMWEMAANLLGRGVNSAQEALKSYQESTTDTASARLMQDVLAAGGDTAAIGRAVAGANPAFLSAEALRFANAQPGVLLERQGAGLQNDIRAQSIKANDYNFERTQLENQRRDADYALMPEAISAMANIRRGLASGDPAQIAAAQEAEKTYLPKYGRAMGIDNAQQVGAWLKGNMDYSNAQMDTNLGRLQYADNLDKALRSRNVREITNNTLGLVNNDPAAALRTVQGMKDLDYETQQAVIGQLTEFQKAMPTNSTQAITDSVSRFTGNQPITLRNTDIVNEVLTAGSLPDNYRAIEYANQGAKRNLPVSRNLDAALNSVMPGLGLTAVVTSGGQSSKEEFAKGTAKSRGYTGSTRHVHGEAADIQMKDAITGRTLSWENPNDVPRLQAAVRNLEVAGLTGFGAAANYMGAETTHVGYGAPAVWGSEGGSPYKALSDALAKGRSSSSGSGPTIERAQAERAASGYQAAMDAISNGQSYNAPVDPTRVQIQNPDGTVSTEKTITTKIDNAWMNIPTIVDGKEVSEEQAIEDFKNGINPAVGVFQSQREAEQAAEARTEEIGRMLDEAVNPVSTTQEQTNAALTQELTPSLSETTRQPESRRVEVTAVDPQASAFRQDIQRFQKTGDVRNALNRFTTELASGDAGGSALSRGVGAAWDYFTASPEDAAANSAARERSAAAMEFYQSEAATKYFEANPEELNKAAADPINFANNFDVGKLPSQDQATQTTGQKPVNPETRPATEAETVDQIFSTIANTAALNQVNNRDQPLIDAIQKGEFAGQDRNQVAARLAGKEGALNVYGQKEVTAGIKEIEDRLGVTPNIAGVLLSMNGTYDDGWFGGWNINWEQAEKDWQKYQSGPGVAGVSDGVGILNASDAAKQRKAEVDTLKDQFKALEADIMSKLSDPNLSQFDRVILQENLIKLRREAIKRATQLISSGSLDANLRARTGE